MGVLVMLSGEMGFDLLETEQLPESIGHSDCGVASMQRTHGHSSSFSGNIVVG